MAFKITGENIYFRKTQESDIDTIATAADFNLSRTVPNTNQKKYFWYRENKANQAAVTSALSSDSMGTMLFTICKKSDDSILGYHNLHYLPSKRVESIFSAIIPSARKNNFYKEVGILRHKFYFEGLQAVSARMKLPEDFSHYLDTLYTSTEYSEELLDQGNWRWSTISSSDWTSWINHSNQASYKNQTYSLTWS